MTEKSFRRRANRDGFSGYHVSRPSAVALGRSGTDTTHVQLVRCPPGGAPARLPVIGSHPSGRVRAGRGRAGDQRGRAAHALVRLLVLPAALNRPRMTRPGQPPQINKILPLLLPPPRSSFYSPCNLRLRSYFYLCALCDIHPSLRILLSIFSFCKQLFDTFASVASVYHET